MDISYEIINSSYFETQSDIIITSTVTETSICQDSLVPLDESKLTNALINDNVSVTYLGLEDGNYLYTLTCTDMKQNTFIKNWNIGVDRIQKIFDESPNLQTLNANFKLLS